MTFYLTCQFQIHINEVRVCGGFKAHVVIKKYRPSSSILSEDRRTSLECERVAFSLHDKKGNHCIAEENFEAGNHCVVDAFSKANNDVCPIFGFGCDIVLCDWCLSSLNHGCLGLNRVLDGDWFFRICCCKICYRPK